MNESGSELRTKTARSLKWNLIDRVSTQILYAVTGIILARTLSQEDFGMVGAILVFQAFASLLVDSGFSSALIQRKSPTRQDYSTILWFNLAIATVLYLLLFVSAPLIADCFQGQEELVPLSRVMFISLILNASTIVQVNRFMKRMDVRPIAVVNAAGLFAGGVTGITLALLGYGAWSIVWQTLVTAGIKMILFWLIANWLPEFYFSVKILKGFFSVGSGVMAQSFLNTVFQNIYSFFIGNRVGLAALGYYTQADKWSKMGITSMSQTMTSAFLPTLSDVQDSEERFSMAVAKMNRLCAYILYPFIFLMIVISTPVFHALFGTKWDASILLFQLLLVRGIFTVLSGLYNNFLLSKAKTGAIVNMEILRDSIALIALFATFPYMDMETPDNPVYGIVLLLYGQIAASMITCIATLWVTSRKLSIPVFQFVKANLPYVAIALAAAIASYPAVMIVDDPWILMAVQSVVFISVYMLVNHILGSRIQKDAIDMLRGRL